MKFKNTKNKTVAHLFNRLTILAQVDKISFYQSSLSMMPNREPTPKTISVQWVISEIAKNNYVPPNFNVDLITSCFELI